MPIISLLQTSSLSSDPSQKIIKLEKEKSLNLRARGDSKKQNVKWRRNLLRDLRLTDKRLKQIKFDRGEREVRRSRYELTALTSRQ